MSILARPWKAVKWFKQQNSLGEGKGSKRIENDRNAALEIEMEGQEGGWASE